MQESRRWWPWLVLSLMLFWPGTVRESVGQEPSAPSAELPEAVGSAGPGSQAPEAEAEGSGAFEVPATGGAAEGYQLRTRRDPFKTFIKVKPPTTLLLKPKRIVTPLERYTLDQLKLVGILAFGDAKKALLEDDVGKGYVVGRGANVGDRGGKIVEIKADRIIIEEESIDALGAKKATRITKKLHTAEEGENP